MTSKEQLVINGALSILGSAIGVFLYQVFLEHSAIVTQRTELRKEIVIQQLPYLQKMRTLADIAQEQAPIPGTFTTSVNNFFSPSDSTLLTDSLVLYRFYPLPRISEDSTLQTKFWALVAEIEPGREKIDSEAYSDLMDITKYLKQNVSTPEWNNHVRGHWIELNKKLIARINDILSLSD